MGTEGSRKGEAEMGKSVQVASLKRLQISGYPKTMDLFIKRENTHCQYYEGLSLQTLSIFKNENILNNFDMECPSVHVLVFVLFCFLVDE